MKILHLVNDEKFINFIKDIFDKCDDTINLFLVLDAPPMPKYVTCKSNNIRFVNSNNLNEINEALSCADGIIVHFLDNEKADIVLRAPKEMPIFWSAWGADYYDNISLGRDQYLGEQTKLLLRKINNDKLGKLRPHLRKIKHFGKQIVLGKSVIKKAIARINYFSSPVPEDYEVVKKHYRSDFKAKYIQINYASVEHTFSSGTSEISGPNILVGNSAIPSNNHLDIFTLLADLDLSNHSLIVPLSYGIEVYKDAIISKGKQLFGEKFVPLVNFMPLKEYNNLIASCSVIIMGHQRQQALGNTATMLYKGAAVFLDELSTVYQYFKKRDAYLFSLQELKNKTVDTSIQLSAFQKQQNREVIEKYWAHSVVVENANHAIKLMRNH